MIESYILSLSQDSATGGNQILGIPRKLHGVFDKWIIFRTVSRRSKMLGYR